MTVWGGPHSIRSYDARGEALSHAPTTAPEPRLSIARDRAELPLAAWRRARAQSNVITLRIPSWASSSSKP